MDGETAVLLRYLDAQRRHVLASIDGLTDEQLRRAVLPSGWSCLGMVKHLALSDEHYWFRSIVGGEPLDFFPEGPNGDWRIEPDDTAQSIVGLYHREIEQANAVIARTPIDMAPRQRDPVWATWGMDFPNLRIVMLHMITETACHAGHLDAAREIIDGKQWVVQ
jgi:hypothetical protein